MATVPAWKKIGLKLDESRDNTSYSGVVHLESANVDKKLAKKLNKKRSREEDKTKATKEKKPPKRVKLPKAERKPPPEKDQLAYLRQYATDRENWKFSKQKQNWILKNLSEVPHEYEENLISYIEGIQGGARDRLIEQLTDVANQWNEVCKAIEEKVNAELYGNGEDEEKKESDEKKEEEKTPLVTRETAIRTKKLLRALTDDPVEFLGLDEEATEAQDSEPVESKLLSVPVDSEIEPKQKPSNDSKEYKENKQQLKNTDGSEESDSEEGSSTNSSADPEDNLIIEHVEVKDYFEDSDSESEKKKRKERSKYNPKNARERRKLKSSDKKP
ncbi:hypothetical protein C7M61_001148 [Candidozyma pseudohaemuli]|uniref:WKF domain-containing protein n=1 Tax=Candidozyma pseudohaemuli TaxID=418784 RepID=A0A2P7YZS6_9ASCO|nr:hypothetical protein C7M61_001148 [[Candida] pseudohaemulonii]PSK41465.1 hypothetical protein C7M61_001148 [[Candida] pseudohaemulonii]